MKSSKSMEIDREDDDDDAYMRQTCTIFGDCFMMDTEKTDVEVILTDDAMGATVEISTAGYDKRRRSFSPLPFLRNESESSTSFFDTLLQLPIAPCAPQDVVD